MKKKPYCFCNTVSFFCSSFKYYKTKAFWYNCYSNVERMAIKLKRNFEITLLKILYVIIALTSFMLIRQYTYTNNYNSANTQVNNSGYVEYQNSDFYELEGEEIYG